MKKVLLLIISLNLYSYDYYFSHGWQMIGVIENIDDMKTFDYSCVEEIWRYDNIKSIWKKYIANSIENNTLESLKKTDGIWIKADVGCPLNLLKDLSYEVLKKRDIYVNEDIKYEVIKNQDRLNSIYSLYLDEKAFELNESKYSAILFINLDTIYENTILVFN